MDVKEKWQGRAETSWGMFLVGLGLTGVAVVAESKHLLAVGVTDTVLSWLAFVWSVVKIGQLR